MRLYSILKNFYGFRRILFLIMLHKLGQYHPFLIPARGEKDK